MTEQIPDPVIWKGISYEILGFKEGELFNPEQYDMHPAMMHTAGWRGYYCTYKIVKNDLYLDKLTTNEVNNYYPSINGSEVTETGIDGPNYSKINLLIPYSGIIRIGADFKEEYYIHMGFQKPFAYGIVWDLEFTDGKLTGSSDISKEVREIEGQYIDEYNSGDMVKKINDSFQRDLHLR